MHLDQGACAPTHLEARPDASKADAGAQVFEVRFCHNSTLRHSGTHVPGPDLEGPGERFARESWDTIERMTEVGL